MNQSTKRGASYGREFDREARVNLAEELRGIVRNYIADYEKYVELSTAKVRDELPAGETLPKYADGEHIPTREYLSAWAEVALRYRACATAAIDGLRNRVRIDMAAAPDATEASVLQALAMSDATADELASFREVMPNKWLITSALRGIAKAHGIDDGGKLAHPYDEAEEAFSYLERGVDAIFKTAADIEGWAESTRRAPTAAENYLVPFEEGRTATLRDQFNAIAGRQREEEQEAARASEERQQQSNAEHVEVPEYPDDDEDGEPIVYTKSGEVTASEHVAKLKNDQMVAAWRAGAVIR